MKSTFLTLIVGMGILMMIPVRSLTAQENKKDTIASEVITLKDRISGIEERIATAESDLYKLTKIKLSGYIQAQYLHLEAANAYPSDLFQLRRARIKVTYEPVQGIVFVLQPDFQPGNITIKDAYVVANEKWLKTFSLWAGKFNRPNYEVEYSSSSREVPERSRLIRAIYPDERALGIKLEANPSQFPLKVQLAVFNGNDGIAINNPVYNYGTEKWENVTSVTQNSDYDNYKDFMGRITYGFKLGKLGGLTIGAHGYVGQIKANSTDVLKSDYTYDRSLDNIGKGVKKQWVGFEAQLYLDVLGGLALKGEYIFGVNSTPGYHSSVKGVGLPSNSIINNDTLTITTTTLTSNYFAPAITRNFMGYYVTLIKNIGKKNQVAVRYDYYNPNTKLAASDVGVAKYDAKVADVVTNSFAYAGTDPVVSTNAINKTTTVNKLTSGTADIPYGTWTFAYTYFFDDNIKFMIAYEIPINRKVGSMINGVNSVKTDYTVNGEPGTYYYNDVINQNTLTIRMQVKF